MKKILSVFAAAALLFGFASCSGDLHDVSAVDLSALQLKGSIFTWDNDDAYKLTPDADGTYYYEFIATASSATFALDDTTGGQTWVSTYRGTSTDELNKSFEKGPATADLYVHNDGDCMPVTLEAGATYKIVVSSGAGFVTCEVKKTADAIPFKIVTKSGNELEMSAVSGTDFAYKLNETEAGTLEFYLKSGVANFAPGSNATLTTGTAEEDIDGTTEKASYYWSYSYEANVPYKISVSYDKDNGTVDLKVGYAFLTSCDILSGSQFSDNKLSWNFTSEYALAEYEFTYDESKKGWGTATEFAVHNSDWSDKYCGGATVELGKDFDELPNSGKNANLKGLVDGTTYILSVKATESKVYAKVSAK